MEPTTGVEPVNLFLTKEALYLLSYVGDWSGRRGSNSRQSAWKAEALPTELLPPKVYNRSLFRIRLYNPSKRFCPQKLQKNPRRKPCSLYFSTSTVNRNLLHPTFLRLVVGGGFEPPKASPTDLQSVPFGHSGTPPY